MHLVLDIDLYDAVENDDTRRMMFTRMNVCI